MKYKRLYETKNKRFYKLNTKIKKGKFGFIKPTQYILVSDSPIYNERLIFAFYFLSGYGELSFYQNKHHFLEVDRVHLIGSVQSTYKSAYTNFNDDYYINKLLELNK